MRFLFSITLLCLSAAAGFAQTSPPATIAAVTQVQHYYASYHSGRLVRAQLLLRDTGYYDGPVDGQWGPETEAGFRRVIDTLAAINGQPAARLRNDEDILGLLDWLGALYLAEAGYQEYPD